MVHQNGGAGEPSGNVCDANIWNREVLWLSRAHTASKLKRQSIAIFWTTEVVLRSALWRRVSATAELVLGRIEARNFNDGDKAFSLWITGMSLMVPEMAVIGRQRSPSHDRHLMRKKKSAAGSTGTV
jgi:hypothetical protein